MIDESSGRDETQDRESYFAHCEKHCFRMHEMQENYRLDGLCEAFGPLPAIMLGIALPPSTFVASQINRR